MILLGKNYSLFYPFSIYFDIQKTEMSSQPGQILSLQNRILNRIENVFTGTTATVSLDESLEEPSDTDFLLGHKLKVGEYQDRC